VNNFVSSPLQGEPQHVEVPPNVEAKQNIFSFPLVSYPLFKEYNLLLLKDQLKHLLIIPYIGRPFAITVA
jgi:hypothetical protein